MSSPKLDPKLDLVFERTTAIAPEKIWKAWTDPQTLMKWFCPRPWKVVEARVDPRAGGEFFTVMQSPEGDKFPGNGCFLEIVPNQKLTWTNMMSAGFRPSAMGPEEFAFTATLLLEKTASGTAYKAIVRHADEAGVKKHQQMNFQEGWGKAFDQLVELMK